MLLSFLHVSHYEQYYQYAMCNSLTGICYPPSVSFKTLVRLVQACNRTNLIPQLLFLSWCITSYMCKIEVTSIGVTYLELTT